MAIEGNQAALSRGYLMLGKGYGHKADEGGYFGDERLFNRHYLYHRHCKNKNKTWVSGFVDKIMELVMISECIWPYHT